MLVHRKIHKYRYTWTSPDGKHTIILITSCYMQDDSQSILHVRSFRGADCDTDRYLVAAEVTDRLSVSKRAA
jgi:hypothetical protein